VKEDQVMNNPARGRARPGRLTLAAERHPAWTDGALCAQADPEDWFPEKGQSTRIAKAICCRCPVKAPCLAYALDRGERFGVWGGLSERERRVLARQRMAAA